MNRRKTSTFINLNPIILHFSFPVRSSSAIVGNNLHRDISWGQLQHFVVNHNIKCTGSQWCHLSQHNILWNPLAIIQLGSGCGIQQNLNSLLKRTTHQSTCIRSVDTMTSNGHQMTTRCHHINQKRHMTVIDVRTIECNNIQNLFVQSRPSSFYTQYRQNFNKVIGISTSWVNTGNCHNIGQVHTIGFQHPLFTLFKLTGLIWLAHLVLHHKHSCDTRNTSQWNRLQHMSLNTFQNLILFRIGILVQGFWISNHSTTNNQLVSSIVWPNNKQIFTKVLRNLFRNLGHCQLFIQHLGTVELQSQ